MPPSLPLSLNLLTSTTSSLFALAALFNPTLLSNSNSKSTAPPSSGEIYYSRLYAARSIPLGFLFGFLPFYYEGPIVRWILVTAGLVQGVDVLIAVLKGKGGKGERFGWVGPLVGMGVHFWAAGRV